MQASGVKAWDLCCRRGDRWLFAGVGLELAPGEVLHLVGANGIGKSSLMRILAGLLPVSAGLEEGAKPGGVAWTGGVGLLDERPALDPAQPLGRALDFWAAIDGTDPDLRAHAAQRLGIAGLMDVPVRYLSTGQKKRAAMARLIGQAAPNWLLDEPFNGLDQQACGLVEEMVMEHVMAGGTCIIASHQHFHLPGLIRLELEEFAL
ncbi:heme ABC exporter ATP-binding protein CcmA [Novosphingobium sp. FSY-8]|uniref:Heme ABC exporter ATP-binding protein CcmA n=1 Tax=Novosphingobium ovatum TaxID=1908523 RepID=A0ABW9XE92_9SPHN|nr:heme ABC exporter ATP-binding protein CcmA [Novosphingobium ovatum]NBC36832.1 heme ABC exporter ATP-binding protein CcmA [Novosphingobium ovatum]